MLNTQRESVTCGVAFEPSGSFDTEGKFSKRSRCGTRSYFVEYSGRIGHDDALQPAVGEFVLVVAEEFEQWSNLLEIRTFRDLVGVPVPRDEPVVLQFREVNVLHLHESREFLVRRFVRDDGDRFVVLWVVGQQRDQQFSALNVTDRIKHLVKRTQPRIAVHTV